MARTTRQLLEDVAATIAPLCSHVSIRKDSGEPLLLAIGLKQLHSLEARAKEGGFLVELWAGPNDADEFIRSEICPTSVELTSCAELWLSREAS